MFDWLINPWMLAALVAMALPIIIEWLFRRRRQRIAFPAMRYLMNPKKRRRVRLQDLILLLVRTVVPGLLVFALARPLLRPDTGDGTDRQPRHVVIVLDGTYSMGQAIGQTTAFAVAQTMGQDVVRGLPKDARISFIYLGNKAEVIKERTADHDSVHDAIGRTKVSDMAGNMADAIAAVDRLLDSSRGEASDLFVISDLQRSTWQPTPQDDRDARALLLRLAGRCAAFVLDTGGENGFNAYLTRFEPRDKLLAVGMECFFEADLEVRNMPATAKLLVTLYADEDKLAAQATQPDQQKPGKIVTRELQMADMRDGKATLAFNHTFVEPGEHLLRVELEGDGLAVDNQQFYLASVPANVEVLIVDPKHDSAVTADPFASNSGFLRIAVAPTTPPGFDRLSPFAVTVRRPEGVMQLNLDRFAVVSLTNVGTLSDSLVSRLEQYVEGGGNLLIFAGEAVVPYEYNLKLLKGGKGLLPCELAPAVGVRPEQAAGQLLALSYAAPGGQPHSAVAEVRQMTRQAAAPSIARYLPLKLRNQAGELGRPVAFLSNQQPAICERTFGQGKVMLVNTSADASWNHLVYTGEYMVLLQELLRHLVDAPDRAVNLRIGATFRQPVLLTSQYLLLRRPDLSKVRIAPVPQGHLWRIAFEDTSQQGIYEVDTTVEVMPRRRFVVNMAATEGDLTRLDAEGFRRDLAQAGASYWGPDKAIQRALEARHSVKEFAWLFLWGLLLLLGVETLLATRFGRRRLR
jgi:hypothetical protein